MENKEGPDASVAPLKNFIRTYGTMDVGLDTTREAWPTLDYVFASRRKEDVLGDEVPRATHEIVGQQRLPRSFLHEHPVDLLIVERGAHITFQVSNALYTSGRL